MGAALDTTTHNLAEVLDEATSILAKFVVPLYEADFRGRPSAHGTCFFVKAGTQHFAVSAAHVLETLAKRPLYYYVSPTVTRRLTGRVLLTPWHGDRERDPIDIGIVKLSGDGQPPYPEVAKFAMDVSYLHPTSLPRSQKHYVIVGFPASRTRSNPVGRTVEAIAYGYRTNSASDGEYVRYDLSADKHLLLPLDLKKGFDSSGVHRNFPKPKGMSGSPIWIMYDENGGEQPRVFPVVAVGTKYWKNKGLLLATDVRVVSEMINYAA